MDTEKILAIQFLINVACLAVFYITEKKVYKSLKEKAMEAKLHVENSTKLIKKQDGLIEEYRAIQKATSLEIEKVQDYLAKQTDQLHIHRRAIKTLRDNQVRRIEIVSKKNFTPVLKKVAEQLKDFN